MPEQQTIRSKDPRKLADDGHVVGWITKKAEGRREVDDGIEPTAPLCRQRPHVPLGVAEPGARAAISRARQQFVRIVHAVHVEARLGEEVRVPPLATRHVKDPRASRKAENLDNPSDLSPISLQTEEGLVLLEVAGIEKRRPPLPASCRRRQKKTGSR